MVGAAGSVARVIVYPRPFPQIPEIIDSGFRKLRGKPVVATRARPRFRAQFVRGYARDSDQSWPANFVTPERSPPAAPASISSGAGAARSTGFWRRRAAGGGRPGAG
jgi:hypothetical protein